MKQIHTSSFGILEYGDAEVIRFPAGLPGFGAEKQFLAIERIHDKPVVFLQSVDRSDLFFIALPIEIIDPEYELQLSDDDLEILEEKEPEPADLICLALVCLPEQGECTANLLGPIVISRQRQIGVQAVRNDSRYSATYPLIGELTGSC